MSYLVLARKFRPQTFAGVVGQEHITRALANAIVRNRVPHALLLTGPRGVGKTTTARVFARALNCLAAPSSESLAAIPEIEARQRVEPCGICQNCKEIAQGSSIAVWEIDGASNNSVDNIREIIESLRSSPPPGARWKIYIIDEVHMLSLSAFNALLKSLEEPPPQTVFIFATTDPQKIPETVISRCQRHDFIRVQVDLIHDHLRHVCEQEKVFVSEEALSFISRRAQGGLRDAQSMLDRILTLGSEGKGENGEVSLAEVQEVFGIVDRQTVIQLAAGILERSPAQALGILDRVFKRSLDLKSFLHDFVAHFRALLVLGVSRPLQAARRPTLAETLELSNQDFLAVEAQLEGQEVFDLHRLFDLAERVATHALGSQYPRYVLEAGVTKMALLSELRPLPEILRAFQGNVPVSVPVLGSVSGSGSAVRPSVEGSPKIVLPKSEERDEIEAFSPTWSEFVQHVKSRQGMVLSSYLSRVGIRKFENGLLEIVADPHEQHALEELEHARKLRECLQSYSGSADWRISISRGEAQKPKSLMQREAALQSENEKRIGEEARKHPLVQASLSTFGGSKVEKVRVLGEAGEDEDRPL